MAETGTMSNLFQNKLFLQYLSGAGNAISQGQPAAPALNQITQQSITAQSKAALQDKYIKRLAGKGIGFKSDPKGGITVNAENIQQLIDAIGGESILDPSNLEGDALSGAVNTLGGGEGISTMPTTPTETKQPSMGNFLNPSDSPAFSGAELAGLTSQDISQALASAMGVEQLRQKSISDISDTKFQEAKIRQINAEISRSNISSVVALGRLGLDRDKLNVISEDADLDRDLKALQVNYEGGRLSLDALNSGVNRLHTQALTKKVASDIDVEQGRLAVDKTYKKALVKKMDEDSNINYLRQTLDVDKYRLMEEDLDLKKKIYNLDELVKIKQITMEKARDRVDKLYKERLGESEVLRAKASTPSITLPGTDIKVTSKQYVDWYKSATKDERTSAIKNYEYAQSEAGGKFKGSFEKFQDNARTSHGKDYEKAVDGGYKGDFNTWMLEMAKAGAITIDQRTAAQEAATASKDINYFSSPKGGLGSSVDKYINSEEVQNQLFTLDPKQRSRRKIELEANQVEREIIGAGGKITGAKMDGRTRVWTVEWANGKTSEVKRGF